MFPTWFPLERKSTDISNPRNFKPITCLKFCTKFGQAVWQSCCITIVMLMVLSILPRRAAPGVCTDHLLLTNLIWHQVHDKQQSLSVAWINYVQEGILFCKRKTVGYHFVCIALTWKVLYIE